MKNKVIELEKIYNEIEKRKLLSDELRNQAPTIFEELSQLSIGYEYFDQLESYIDNNPSEYLNVQQVIHDTVKNINLLTIESRTEILRKIHKLVEQYIEYLYNQKRTEEIGTMIKVVKSYNSLEGIVKLYHCYEKMLDGNIGEGLRQAEAWLNNFIQEDNDEYLPLISMDVFFSVLTISIKKNDDIYEQWGVIIRVIELLLSQYKIKVNDNIGTKFLNIVLSSPRSFYNNYSSNENELLKKVITEDNFTHKSYFGNTYQSEKSLDDLFELINGILYSDLVVFESEIAVTSQVQWDELTVGRSNSFLKECVDKYALSELLINRSSYMLGKTQDIYNVLKGVEITDNPYKLMNRRNLNVVYKNALENMKLRVLKKKVRVLFIDRDYKEKIREGTLFYRLGTSELYLLSYTDSKVYGITKRVNDMLHFENDITVLKHIVSFLIKLDNKGRD